MIEAQRWLLVVGMALLSGGCWTETIPPLPETPLHYQARTVETVHFVSLGESEVLSERERAGLDRFLGRLPRRYPTTLFVNSGGPRAEAQARAVLAFLDAQGPADVFVQYRDLPGPVIVTARTDLLAPDLCDGEGDPDLGVEVPLGCADAYNLSRMIEQPRDLLRGRRPGNAFAAPVARSAETYLGLGTRADGGQGGAPADARRADVLRERLLPVPPGAEGEAGVGALPIEPQVPGGVAPQPAPGDGR
jgi:hypothetical protein